MTTLARAWPFWLALALGGWLGASRLHAYTNADALVPSLVSLQALTPFFWRQDRYGMLWAYLWHPVHHPLHNLIGVFACNVAAGLVAQVLLSRLLWPGRGAWPLVAVCSMAATLGLGAPHYVAEVLGPAQFFSTPLALGLGGLELWRWGGAPRRALGGAALLTCGWYNPSVPVLLGLLLVARAAPRAFEERRVGRGPLKGLVGCALALAFGLTCMRASAFAQFSPTRTSSPWLWPATLVATLRSAAGGGDLPAPFVTLLGLGLLATLLRACLGGVAGRGARPAACGAWACAAYLVLVASQGWVRQENCSGRFVLPACFVAWVVAVGGLVAPLARAPRRVRRAVAGAAVLGCVLACQLRFGPPDASAVGRHLADRAGVLGRQAMVAHCTHLAGDYWSVWPAVFFVAWQRHAAGEALPVFGVAHRAEATRALWPHTPRPWRYCALPAELPVARQLLGYFGAPAASPLRCAEAPDLVVAEAP